MYLPCLDTKKKQEDTSQITMKLQYLRLEPLNSEKYVAVIINEILSRYENTFVQILMKNYHGMNILNLTWKNSPRLMAFYIENNDFKLKKVMLLLCYLPFYINLCITCLEKSI